MKHNNIRTPSIGLQNNINGLENHGVLLADHLDCSLIPRNTDCVSAKSDAEVGPSKPQRRTSRQVRKRLFLCANSPRVMAGSLGSFAARRFLCGGRTNPNSLPPNSWSYCVAVNQPHTRESIMSNDYVRPRASYVYISAKYAPQHREAIHNTGILSQYDGITRMAISRLLMTLDRGEGVVIEWFHEPSKISPRYYLMLNGTHSVTEMKGVAA